MELKLQQFVRSRLEDADLIEWEESKHGVADDVAGR